jgi:hypothetical protein
LPTQQNGLRAFFIIQGRDMPLNLACAPSHMTAIRAPIMTGWLQRRQLNFLKRPRQFKDQQASVVGTVNNHQQSATTASSQRPPQPRPAS